MIKILMYLDFLVLFFLILFHVHTMKQSIAPPKAPGAASISLSIPDSFIKVGILYVCWELQLPVFLLYALLYMSYFVTCSETWRASKLLFYFWVNIHFIALISLHLICLSGISAAAGISLYEAFYSQDIWLIVMTLSLAFLNLLEFLSAKGAFYQIIRVLSKDTARFRQFIHFEWYSVSYLMFDSISCFFYLPYTILSVFLIGSCILLLLQVLLFILHTYRIIEKAHYESEYYRLEKERSDHIKKEMELKNLAYIDTLTGTYTRRYAMEMLESLQKDHKSITLAYIDVNGLKKVNDNLGHLEGDQYLIAIANSLNSGLRKNDVLARIGGDEFLIITSGMGKDSLKALLNHINHILMSEKSGHFPASFSFGIVEAEEGSFYNIEDLLLESDKLMYAYKKEFKKGERTV